ncbi:MAG: phytoene desaturase family protein, partial [Anaerolineaceae bacterium]
DMLKIAPDLIRCQSHKSVYQYIAQFIQDDFLRQVFSFHPLLIGGNPCEVPSFYAMIQFLARQWGVYFARGGTGALVKALERLFTELGGKVHINTDVSQILVDGGKVIGLRLADGSIHQADVVVSNADVAWTYQNLIPARYRWRNSDRRYRRMRYSMSLFVIYFGTRRRYLDSNLAHHNIILPSRYTGLLNDIFKRKALADDFFLYLQMPTITDPSLAPEGYEAFSVLSPVPHLGSGINWSEAARPYRDRIMEFLERNYLPDLRANIVAEHYIDPLHFQGTLNTYMGAAFSVAPVINQLAWFRPHNRSEDFDNLYFVGAGTHPGAGLPGVLSSALIAENLIFGESQAN